MSRKPNREAKMLADAHGVNPSTRTRRPRSPRDTTTPERLARAGAGGHEVDPNGRQRIVEAPLDRMWKSGHLTEREFTAADRYRADAYMAAIDPGAMTVDWSRTGSGTSVRVPSMFTAQHIADARHRIRELEQKIPRKSAVATLIYLGVVLERELTVLGTNVFGIADAREALIAGRAGLRTACAALADAMGA